MDEPKPGVQAQTLALDTLIRETVSRAGAGSGDAQEDTMLFLGNRHQSFPALVVGDPVLEPVDKLVWMVIMLAVTRTTGAIAFPSYEVIGRTANVSSRSTVARAIAILRATRWLTLCARVRNATGQFRGNVYALHDEPLPLADALHLDSGYMAFLVQLQAHGHARVRAVAKGILDSMDEDIGAGLDVAAREHPLERRTKALSMTEERGGARRYFAFTENVVRQLRNKPHRPGEHHDQKSNPVPSSSSYINKTTTTTPPNRAESKPAPTAEDGGALVYPRRLSPNQREVADRYLRGLDAAHRQPVLDELEGRYRAEQKGMDPLYDELSFLHALCRAARAGEFHANLGLRVRAERIELERARRSASAAGGTTEESAEQRTERLARHRRGVARLKASMGLHTSTTKQKVTGESSSK